MNVLQTFEFAIISVLYLFTITQTIDLIAVPGEYTKKQALVLTAYIASGCICSWNRDSSHPIVFLVATMCFYSLLLIYNIMLFKTKKSTAVYVSIMILVLDSIFQSVGCILIELFTQEFNRSFVLNTSSLLFNIITLALIRVLKRNYKNQIRNTVNLLSKKLYILILAALIIVGELCGNMAVESNELYFDNRINIFLTSLTIVAFLIIIISLIFSSISTRYYENISRIMEKQVNDQVEHYKKINKLTDDLREFRHDYKNHMICLQAMLEKGLLDDAIEYTKNITKQDLVSDNKFSTGNQIADSILAEKEELAERIGCHIKVTGFISDEIAAVNLCIMLFNALDNALEACAKIKASKKDAITVKCAIIQNVQIIRISNPNPCNNDFLDTSKADKDNHGFGLYNIRKTVEKLGGEMKIPSKFPEFVLELEFPIK